MPSVLAKIAVMNKVAKDLANDFAQEWKSFMADVRSSKADELARWEEPPVMVEKPKPSAVVVKHPAPPSAHVEEMEEEKHSPAPAPAPPSAHVKEMEEETDWGNTAFCLTDKQARQLRAKLAAVERWEDQEEDAMSSAPTPVRVHFGPEEVFPVPCEGKGRPTPKPKWCR